MKTTTAALAGKAGEACLLRSAVTNERLAVVYSMDGYSVNSVARSAATIHRRLVEYLSARSVDIEIWSADSEMQIGVPRWPFFSDVVDAVDVIFWFDSSIDQWEFEGQVVMGTEHHKHKGPCTESEMDHRDGSQA